MGRSLCGIHEDSDLLKSRFQGIVGASNIAKRTERGFVGVESRCPQNALGPVSVRNLLGLPPATVIARRMSDTIVTAIFGARVETLRLHDPGKRGQYARRQRHQAIR